MVLPVGKGDKFDGKKKNFVLTAHFKRIRQQTHTYSTGTHRECGRKEALIHVIIYTHLENGWFHRGGAPCADGLESRCGTEGYRC